jgi:hypothetical protein
MTKGQNPTIPGMAMKKKYTIPQATIDELNNDKTCMNLKVKASTFLF